MKAICEISGYQVTGIFGHWEPFSKYRKFEVQITEEDLSSGCIPLTKGDNPIYLDFEQDDYEIDGDVVLINSDNAWSRTNY